MEDSSVLVWGVLFGAIGLGYMTYSRRQSAIMPLVAGIALIIFPYFMPNTLILLAVGVALVALPFFIRW